MGWVAHKILVLSPRPLGFWFWGLGPGLDNCKGDYYVQIFCNNSEHYVQISLWFCPGFCMHLKSIKLDPALTLELMNFDAGYSYSYLNK